MSAGETKPNPPKAPPSSQEHSGEGSVGPRRDSHKASGGLEGSRDLPPFLSVTPFLKEVLFGGAVGHKGRWQAWSHRAELFMQSMNPAIPCQAAAEANEEGCPCAGEPALRLLLPTPTPGLCPY